MGHPKSVIISFAFLATQAVFKSIRRYTLSYMMESHIIYILSHKLYIFILLPPPLALRDYSIQLNLNYFSK